MDSSRHEFEAAVSALLDYGFSEVLIRHTLKDILKVYAGDDAWPLIKENGYEVLLDRLLSNDLSQEDQCQKVLDQKENVHVHTNSVEETHRFTEAGLGSSIPSAVKSSVGLEPADIHTHQWNSWTRHGSFPVPAWLRTSSVSNIKAQQKYLDFHELLDRVNNDSINQGQSVNDSTIDDVDVAGVSDVGLRCTEEIRPPECLSSFKLYHKEIDEIAGSGKKDPRAPNPGLSRNQSIEKSNSRNYAQTYAQQFDVSVNHAERGKEVLLCKERFQPATTHHAGPFAKRTTVLHRSHMNEELDVARMSACKLSRRRDGGLNPMFSRLQMRKLAVANSGQQIKHNDSDLNEDESGSRAIHRIPGPPRLTVRIETRKNLSTFQ
ncbi:hypothetical protein KP509_03G001700 [Ceratopteris richardii]|nr:hypothetical protein KP509_03G001700 [Ceratopteris richardii]